MGKTIVITGAGSGFGALTSRALAAAGHTVYAGVREIDGRNRDRAEAIRDFADHEKVDLRVVEMDVVQQISVDAAVQTILREQSVIDVIIHNAGHMVLGPSEAFTTDQFAQIYDTNVLSTQRLNRAILPHMRERRDGLLLWISSSSVKGGTPPFLGPYFAAKAAMDSLAVSYAGNLLRWGIDTSIVVPGAFTTGTDHFAGAGYPADESVAAAYEAHYAGLNEYVGERLSELFPPEGDVSQVADEVVRIVGLPKGERPFRVHIDPLDDGSEEVADVADRVRNEFLHRVGLEDLLHVSRQ